MNFPEGKAILALARDGDHAHSGEEEAIRLAARLAGRTEIRRILDVGSGRGGTAAWFAREGWGESTGVDIDAASIKYARDKHPSLTFISQEAGQLGELGLPPFDLVYLLTAL
jgi:2-polyprenyl-3-methyl-5-hydroxy-6-metoxy-1,4-benzoquinol methylase